MFTPSIISWFLWRLVSSNMCCKMLRSFLLFWEWLLAFAWLRSGLSTWCFVWYPFWTSVNSQCFVAVGSVARGDAYWCGSCLGTECTPTPLIDTVTLPVTRPTSLLAVGAQVVPDEFKGLVHGPYTHTSLFCFKGFPANRGKGAGRVNIGGKLALLKKAQKVLIVAIL